MLRPGFNAAVIAKSASPFLYNVPETHIVPGEPCCIFDDGPLKNATAVEWTRYIYQPLDHFCDFWICLLPLQSIGCLSLEPDGENAHCAHTMPNHAEPNRTVPSHAVPNPTKPQLLREPLQAH